MYLIGESQYFLADPFFFVPWFGEFVDFLGTKKCEQKIRVIPALSGVHSFYP